MKVCSLMFVVSIALGKASSSSTLKTTAFWPALNQGRASAPNEDSSSDQKKLITFVRHGCTYMNEYLGGADGGRRFGSPNFTDVFPADRQNKYLDTPLSPLGRKQALALAAAQSPPPFFVQDCELVVVSPLTRALQTFDIGLKRHFFDIDSNKNIPVVALPEAAERLYLISDVGRSVAELQTDFSYVDFETGFRGRHDDTAWWYPATAALELQQQQEWRPVGNGQRYACPGEPMAAFDRRMSQFHAWLEERPEQNIVVVCHHGVIDWMLDMDFANCQYRQVPFSSILQPHRRALLRKW